MIYNIFNFKTTLFFTVFLQKNAPNFTPFFAVLRPFFSRKNCMRLLTTECDYSDTLSYYIIL